VGGHLHGRGRDPGDPRRQPGCRLDAREHAVRVVDETVAGGHVAAGQTGADPMEQGCPVRGRIVGEVCHQLGQHRFGLAHDHQVGERSQRLRVHEHRHSAEHHQRAGGGDPVGPFRGQGGDTARGQHRGQARVIVFKADRGEHQGEVGERPGGFERAQRPAVGRVDEPLADHLVQAVEQGVDQLVAEVGHGHRVGVGVEQGHGQPARPLLADRALFSCQDGRQGKGPGVKNTGESVCMVSPWARGRRQGDRGAGPEREQGNIVAIFPCASGRLPVRPPPRTRRPAGVQFAFLRR
jgi:hypothetical protein